MSRALRHQAAYRATPGLAAFRGAHQGESIVVCGCGESLRELTQPQGFVTIGVNDVGRLFDPTYLVVVNPRGQFKGDRFSYVERSNARALFTQLDLGAVKPPVVRFKLGKYAGTEIGTGDVLHYAQNSPYVAVCLAAFMGAARIGLIGVDLTDHHFFARTGRHSLSGRLAEIDAQYARLAISLRARGIELVNLSSISRLKQLPRETVAEFATGAGKDLDAAPGERRLRIVSYATTPVAGVPAVLSRCINASTPHRSRCVWAADRYANGVSFEGDVEWQRRPGEATQLLSEADVVVVHNGKVSPSHLSLLRDKAVLTLAHNYGWNVDMQFVARGMPGLVMAQYQATLPEFDGWHPVGNPIPIGEPDYMPAEKGDGVVIAYTPSARHERYRREHKLYWHGKGFDTTMRVLERLARRPGITVLTTAGGPVSLRESLAMKRRAHIVIDECVTGSYHRNSLEGLAAGCVVVNGIGLLAGVDAALLRCAGAEAALPFVFSTLESLETVLAGLVERGPQALRAEGLRNREWIERHWDFAEQWRRLWAGPVGAALAARAAAATPVAPPRVVRPKDRTDPTKPSRPLASVIIPHSGTERLRHLAATLATLNQRSGVGEIIVVETGREAVAGALCARWADKHLFIEHEGPFERGRALNAGEPLARHDYLLWHDNDVLVAPGLIETALSEMQSRSLDFLIPVSEMRYLSQGDSEAVMQGTRDPADCRPASTWSSGQVSGAVGLVRRDFIRRHGGFIDGFKGWGGEDNAWNHKARVLGRWGVTLRRDQRVFHLFHPGSGGYRGSVGAAHPNYRDNVELLNRVLAIRQGADLERTFPPCPPASGSLTAGRARDQRSSAPTVWTYWEGPCPAWIKACRRTLVKFAPSLRLLTPETFDELRDSDRDIDLSRLRAAHRADYARAYLLHRYGGMWIDADCVLLKPVQPLLDLLARCDFVGHRERSGLVSNAFIAAPRDSRIASDYYSRVAATLRSRSPLGWTSIGSEPLTAAIASDSGGWHELPCESVQPICWSEPQKFFAIADEPDHRSALEGDPWCYMMSNERVAGFARNNPRADLMHPSSFFSFLIRQTLGPESPATSRYEEIFARHAEQYRALGGESTSGPGSGLGQTAELRERLPLILSDLSVKTLVDAPCGDYHWMKRVELGLDEYIGVDVLRAAVADLQARYGNARRRFACIDVTHDCVPRADAIFCRDLLTHLSYAEIRSALGNFRRSGARYLLTTTFTDARPNRDTSGGNWRTLNLRLPPFDFPEPMRIIREKCSEGRGAYHDKSIGAWLLADLPADWTAPAGE